MSELTFTHQIGHHLFDDYEVDGTYEFTVEVDEDGFSLTSLVLQSRDIANELTSDQETVANEIIREELWRQDFEASGELAIQRQEDRVTDDYYVYSKGY